MEEPKVSFPVAEGRGSGVYPCPDSVFSVGCQRGLIENHLGDPSQDKPVKDCLDWLINVGSPILTVEDSLRLGSWVE